MNMQRRASRGFRGRLRLWRHRARPRAGVADEAGPHRRAVPPGRHDRHRRPLARCGAAEDVGTAGRHRQPGRRRRQHRRGRRRQESGRRLHDADGHRRHACDQRRPVRAQRTEDAVRSGKGFRSRHALRSGAERDGDQSQAAGEFGAGVHRVREGQSRQAQHGLERKRHVDPPVRRALQDRHGDLHGSLPVSRIRAGHHGPDRRQHERDVRQPALRAPAHQERPPQGARRDVEESLPRVAAAFRPSNRRPT